MNKQKILFEELPKEPTIYELQQYFKKIFQIRGFEDENIIDKVILLMEEVGELAKAIRKEKKVLSVDYNRLNEYESISSELADVFIVLLSMCNAENINLTDAILKKEKLNINREWKKI